MIYFMVVEYSIGKKPRFLIVYWFDSDINYDLFVWE